VTTVAGFWRPTLSNWISRMSACKPKPLCSLYPVS